MESDLWNIQECTSCHEHKPREAFPPDSNFPFRINPRCKECRNAYIRKRNTPERNFRRSLRYYYGITPEQYQELLVLQNHRCAICDIHEDDIQYKGSGRSRTDGTRTRNIKLHVDHCHKSGKIRALLCTNCNAAIGMVKENVKTLKRMIEYLSD